MKRSKLDSCFFLLTLAAFFVGGKLGYATGGDPSDTTEANQQSENEEPVFESRRQQIQYDKILNRLERMETGNGSSPGPEDWFVVGGLVGDAVNFDVLQGTKVVARRVVEFTTAYDNNCRWRIFDRTSDETEAREMLVEVKSRYENWRRRYQSKRSRCRPRG